MRKQEILDKIHTRTYHIAETKKSESPEIALIQTSNDQADILTDYMQSAIDYVSTYLQKRLISVLWNGDELVIESPREKATELTKSLDRAIADYLVEEVLNRWLSDTYPQLANPMLAEVRLDRVKTCACALAPNVRRRAAVMGI